MPVARPIGPLPRPIDPFEPTERLPIRLRSIRCGCWLISYRPTGSRTVAYDGTLRVECHSDGRTASGDLYQRRLLFIREPWPVPRPPFGPPLPLPLPVLGPAPNPAKGIPIQPRSRYRFYKRVTSLPERWYFGSRFNLKFELYRFTAPNTWATTPEVLTAQMVRMAAPAAKRTVLD
jgi:hypothetical protein